MRVLHITHLYPRPYDQLLGIAMHNAIKALEAQGCIQKVLSPTAWAPFPIMYLSHKWKSYSQVPNRDVIEGIEAYYPRYLVFPKALLLASSGVRMYWGIKRLVREIEPKFPFDLIHAHMALPDGYAGMLISMEYRKPLVVTFQATDLDISANRSQDCLSALERVFSYAKQVISPSPRLAKAFVSRFRIKPVVIGYGISAGEVFTGNSDLLSAYEGRRVLLSVSRLISIKGIDLNIRAIKQLTKKYENILYLVVGDGPERTKLEELTRDLGLTSYVVFVGQVSQEQVMKYMASCEVFTLPSWQETFGLVYVEAMAHAKPVIAVRGQGVDGIVIYGETGLLVKPRDLDSLVEALDFLLSHPEEARAMGERARKMVLEDYTWEKNAEKTIELYREVLNER
ncbi:MAG: glycosyltransferase family 4 protein [Firmicutes bacterium]|nr:glycosyltransferase family 4 protein [Bacillota bacterium]